jgi:GWxTD domain-containing protein
MNIGGDVQFGKNVALYFQCADKNPAAKPKVTYQLFRLNREEERQLILSDTLPEERLALQQTLQLENKENTVTFKKTTAALPNVTVLLPLRADSLEQGMYQLHVQIKDGKAHDSLIAPLRIRWTDMPLSLTNLDYALNSLRFITTEEQLDELTSGSREKERQKFLAFWKQKDPTPSTAYNEVMAEYYKRVDYAFFNFNVLGQPDGTQTDRGKIYILYGPPMKTERNFSPNNPPQEVWYYTNVGKKFIFIDESRTGKYKLATTEKL